MAHLQHNQYHISKAFSSQLLTTSWRYRGGTITFVSNRNLSRFNNKNRGRNLETRSSSSIQTPAAEVDGKNEDRKGQFGHLVSENGWKVRRIIEKIDELREVAHIQAQAFHQPSFLFNDLLFKFFEAEVLAGLMYTLKNSPSDRYACLVAEPTVNTLEQVEQQLVGVVDVTVQRDNDVLLYLSKADEYLYISGIAVLQTFRRKKVATVLLKACEMLAIRWGFEYLALRAYEDDMGARTLYTNAGYRMVSGDPLWKSTWIGRRRRVLLIKKSNSNTLTT